MSHSLLSNIVWHTLDGPHREHSVGTATARRYAPGFSPLIAFADPQHPDWNAAQAFCAPGEQLYNTGAPPTGGGWQVEEEAVVVQMLWAGAAPAADAALGAVRLGPQHTARMLELVSITHPGPFGERTVELGEYYGVFDDGDLVAMAGERFAAGRLREISAVCTLPRAQGKGLARRLMQHLLRIQLARGQTPFLHVMHGNHTARQLYARLGFRDLQSMAVRIVSRACQQPLA
jgi:GNAT superfamily N-acetyltransferase